MPLDWKPFVEALRRHNRFLLTTHVRPDGDGLGSMKALADILGRQGKEVHLVTATSMPDRYRFLDPEGQIVRFSELDDRWANAEVVIVLDTGTWNQLAGVGDVLKAGRAEIAVIDHHRTQDDLGATRFVDVAAAATGEMICDAIAALGVPLSPAMARNLFVALAWDTGWFRHPNATEPIYNQAGRLIAAGANPTVIHEELYERKTLPALKLQGRLLDRIETRAGGRVSFSHVVFADYAETGAIPLDTEDLINFPRSIAGVEVALIFMEQRDGTIKVSFRARRADVGQLAE